MEASPYGQLVENRTDPKLAPETDFWIFLARCGSSKISASLRSSCSRYKFTMRYHSSPAHFFIFTQAEAKSEEWKTSATNNLIKSFKKSMKMYGLWWNVYFYPDLTGQRERSIHLSRLSQYFLGPFSNSIFRNVYNILPIRHFVFVYSTFIFQDCHDTFVALVLSTILILGLWRPQLWEALWYIQVTSFEIWQIW